MKPETIIAELRRINAWRRGDETIEQPEPTHFGEVLDAAADEIAKLLGALALGQENCDAEYEELRRERDIARDGLRDSAVYQCPETGTVASAMGWCAIASNLRARVAELGATLREARSYVAGHTNNAAMQLHARIRSALARIESTTPAKHPDTERLDWLAGTTNGVSFAFGSGKPIVSQGAAFPQFTGEDLRAAIDAARKQGGAQ